MNVTEWAGARGAEYVWRDHCTKAATSLIDSLGLEENVNGKAYHESAIIDTDRGVCDDRTLL
jgi:hypothetical protein